jgi:hypothetical protein
MMKAILYSLLHCPEFFIDIGKGDPYDFLILTANEQGIYAAVT